MANIPGLQRAANKGPDARGLIPPAASIMRRGQRRTTGTAKLMSAHDAWHAQDKANDKAYEE